MSVPDDLEPRIDALYGLPLEHFTAERNRLASELSKRDRAAATAVRALKKPSVPAWAVNQLFRVERARFDELLEAGSRLHAAQREVLAGRGRSALDQAAAHEQAALQRLRDAARGILETRGSTSTALLDRVTSTLRALARRAPAEETEPLGRLTEELAPLGLQALLASAGAVPPPDRRGAAAPDGEAAPRARSARPAGPADDRAAKKHQPRGQDRVVGEHERALAARRAELERQRAQLEQQRERLRMDAKRRRSDEKRLARELERAERRLPELHEAAERAE